MDSYNHTGYAQVLEETIVDNLTPSTNTITYTIGDDIITQATNRHLILSRPPQADSTILTFAF